MIGCSKEQIVEDNTTVEKPAKGNVVSFTAVIPDFVSPDTKATVDGTSFTWQADDKIAVPVSGGYVDFTYSGAGNTFSRVLDGSEEFVDGTAYYPASSAPGGSYSTSFATVADAQKGFKMEAEYTVGSSSLSFTHKSALIHLQFTNVPSIATKLVVNDGTNDVAVVNFTSPSSTMEFFVPIAPNGSKTYTFKLQENSNVLKQVAKTAALAANTYYTTPSVPVGHIIRVQDAVKGWDSKALYFRNVNNSEDYKLFTTGDSYPYKFNTISATDHYIVTPSEISWMGDGYPVVISFRTESDSKSTYTDCVWLYRDITFTVPEELGLKADYRIYPHGGSYSKPYAQAYPIKEVTLKVNTSAISFGTPYIHILSGERATSWSSKADMVDEGSNVYSYTFPVSYFNKTVEVVICNSKTGSGWQTNNYTCDFTSKDSFTISLGDGGYGNNATTSETATGNNIVITNILGSAPGTAFTSPGSLSNSTYLTIPSTYYGQYIRVIFSDNGSDPKDDWNFIINRDLDYGL